MQRCHVTSLLSAGPCVCLAFCAARVYESPDADVFEILFITGRFMQPIQLHHLYYSVNQAALSTRAQLIKCRQEATTRCLRNPFTSVHGFGEENVSNHDLSQERSLPELRRGVFQRSRFGASMKMVPWSKKDTTN